MKWILYHATVLIVFFHALVQSEAMEPGVLARIALVSDTHTTRGTNEDQPRYRARLDQVIASVNATKVDLVLIAGDLTQNGNAEELADFKEQTSGFNAPILFVPGNHDIGNKRIRGKRDEGGLTPFRLARFEMRCGPSYFARTFERIRVIGLNSPIMGSGFAREESMWRFLQKELAQPSKTPTLVFMHYPPFTKTPNEPSDYWNIEPEPRQHLLKLLHEGGVKTVLSGHLHRSLTNRNEGILFLTTGPVSFGLPRGKQPQGWTLVTVPETGEVHSEFRAIKD
jgi:3',5'-cyclic AMP phosphodiesterase CpdA